MTILLWLYLEGAERKQTFDRASPCASGLCALVEELAWCAPAILC